MSNVAEWCLVGDHEGLVEVSVDVGIPNKHLQDQHSELHRPDLEMDSEVASVVEAGSVEASVATEEALATEVAFEVVAASATKIVVALANDEAATRAGLHHLMHPVDQAVEVGMEEGMKIGATALEVTAVAQEATKIRSVVEIVGMIVSVVATETETEIVIETAIDTAEAEAEADATTTTAQENGIMRTMGTTTRDRDGDTDFEPVIRIGRCLLQLWTTVGWWVSFYHPCIQIIFPVLSWSSTRHGKEPALFRSSPFDLIKGETKVP